MVLGEGKSECSSSNDCGRTQNVSDSDDGVHRICETINACVYVSGEGYDECKSDLDCEYAPLPEGYGSAPPVVPGSNDPTDEKRYICKDEACVYVEGEGEDECADDSMCKKWLSVGGFDFEQDARLPQPLDIVIGNEKVNFYIGPETYHADLQGGIVLEGGEGEMQGNTVNVITDAETAAAIESGKTTIQEALEEDKIVIEGEGFVEGIKWAILNFLYDMGMMATDR